MNLIGATSLGWGHAPLDRIFAELHLIGGQCIELNGRPGQHDGLTITGSKVDLVLSWAANSEITISSVAGYNDFAQTDPKELDREVESLLQACGLASELGVSIVRAFAGEPKTGTTLATMWPRIIEGFRHAAPSAESMGVTLAIENHGHLVNDGILLARLIEEIGSPHVRLNLDTGNFSWAGHELDRTWRDFEAALPYAVNVHIKDVTWDDSDPRFVAAGTGDLNLDRLLLLLRHRDYQGAILSEYEGALPHLQGTQQSITYLLESQSTN